MKCGYCKGEVPKEEAVKDKSYFHKECYKKKIGKKEIEEYWLTEINNGTVLQLLRKVIKESVEIYEVDYILWVLKNSKSKGIKLQYPQGLKRLLDQNEFKQEWSKSISICEYNKLKDEIIENTEDDVNFNYKPKTNKITDLI